MMRLLMSVTIIFARVQLQRGADVVVLADHEPEILWVRTTIRNFFCLFS
ncbi:MAG: hypothetical protein GTO13_10325 [Proteobacteria bacterium]|nr:hypothetical protein [Pseudomonadota bacterium]